VRTLVRGLAFAEAPRWHDGALWWSDFYTHRVQRLAWPDGAPETVCEVPGQPSGLGWLPDGRLLVVSMLDRRLLRLEPDGRLVEHADLSALAAHPCNELLVGADGTAWVGHFGYDLFARAPVAPASLLAVRPDGQVRVAAADLMFPNGMVLAPDGGTLIVAETAACRLTAFDVGAGGALGARRVWADLGPLRPDGICLDAEGAVWVAALRAQACVRVFEGGRIDARLGTPDPSIACMLAGPDRRSLCLVTGHVAPSAEALVRRSAAVHVVEVAVPGAGRP
jgi:sugar lactone lactonase YvrE